jgi:hypothetical protein
MLILLVALVAGALLMGRIFHSSKRSGAPATPPPLTAILRGASLLNLTTAPTSADGQDGDSALVLSGGVLTLYGPKAGGVWPAGVVVSGGGTAPTLATLGLSATTFTNGTATSGTITGATTSSTIALTNGPAGLTINSAARTWAFDGSATAGSGTLTLTETLAGAIGSPKATNIGWTVAAAGSAGARTAPTITRTSANTTYPPTVDYTRPGDWIDGDKAVARWSANEDMSSATEGAVVTLASGTTSNNFGLATGLPNGTTGTRYIQFAAWDGTGSRPGSLNWSNKVAVNDTAAAGISTASTFSVNEQTPLAISLAADKTVTWSIAGGVDQSQFEIIGSTLRWVGNGSQTYATPVDNGFNNVYDVIVQATTLAGVSTTKALAGTVLQLDLTPDALSFTPVTSASYSTVYTSNTATVSGLGSGLSVSCSVSGGTYSKNGGAYTSAAGTVTNGDTITLRGTSPAADSLVTTVTFTAGGVPSSYTVATPGFAAKLVIGSGSTGSGADRSQYIDSTDGFVATVNSSTNLRNLVRSNNAPPSKFHFEVEIMGLNGSGNGLWIGVVDAADAVGPNLNLQPGASGGQKGCSLNLQATQTTNYPSANGAVGPSGYTTPAVAVGSKFAVECDTSTNVVNFYSIVGTTGTLIGSKTLTSQIPTSYRAFVGGAFSGDSLRFNAGAYGAFSMTPTSGFTGW